MQQILIDLAQKLLPAAQTLQQARTEAWLLLEKVTGKNRTTLLTTTAPLSLAQHKQLNELVDERVKTNKPLAYILGTVPFGDLTLLIRPPILIPRPETEEMVYWIIKKFSAHAKEPLIVFDLCTGSGCIALALAAAFPCWNIIGIDINPVAINLAEENKKLAGLNNVTFKQGSIFTPSNWATPCDLIVSNPPYINRQSINLVGHDVLAWEDEQALFADKEGWAFYEAIAQLGKQILAPQNIKHPNLIWEFGVDQTIMDIFLRQSGYRSIEINKDCAGLNRWAGSQV